MGALPVARVPDLSAIDPPRFAMETVEVPPFDEPLVVEPPPEPKPPEPLPPPPEPEVLRLGMQTSAQADAPAWIGFEQYEEHSAKPSEIDQPELTMDPPPGAPLAQPAMPAIAGAAVQTVPEEPTQAPEPSPAPEPAAPAEPSVSSAADGAPSATEAEPIIAPVMPKPVEPPPPAAGGVSPMPSVTDRPLPQSDTPPSDEPGIQPDSSEKPGDRPDESQPPREGSAVDPAPEGPKPDPMQSEEEPMPGPLDVPPRDGVEAAGPRDPSESLPEKEEPSEERPLDTPPSDAPEPPPDTGPLPSDEAAAEPAKPGQPDTRPVAEPSPETPTPPPNEPGQTTSAPTPGAPAQPAIPAGAGETSPGTQSDRESSATSVMTARRDQLGKPIAGKGLEIKTVRPRFTQYTRIMSAPRSPIYRIHFRRDGTVEKVETIRSSGVSDVDRPVIDAIYKWRAVGEELDRLPSTPSEPGGKQPTLAIEMRILL